MFNHWKLIDDYLKMVIHKLAGRLPSSPELQGQIVIMYREKLSTDECVERLLSGEVEVPTKKQVDDVWYMNNED